MGTGRVDPRLVRGADKHGSKPFGGTSEGALNRLFSGTHAKMGRDNFAPSGSSFLLPRFWFLLPGNAFPSAARQTADALFWVDLPSPGIAEWAIVPGGAPPSRLLGLASGAIIAFVAVAYTRTGRVRTLSLPTGTPLALIMR